MAIELFSLYHEGYVREFLVIKHIMYTSRQLLFHFDLAVEEGGAIFRARISIQNIHVFKIVLAITTSNNIKLMINQRHGMASPSLGAGVVVGVAEIVAMLPC